MNNIDKLWMNPTSPSEYAKGYIKYVTALLNNLDTESVGALIENLKRAREDENTVFIIGNGGSASTASHMANDIGLDVLKKSGTDRPFKVLSLTDNNSVLTAICNDDGYENLFLYQLKILYKPGDKLIAISVSGNSPNVVCAAEWVKAQGGTVMGLGGFDGGQLKELCDVFILVETLNGEYGPVEDVHLVIDHLIANYLLSFVKAEKENK
jgi:D-sedoheptulose 7-phosphate isomerase